MHAHCSLRSTCTTLGRGETTLILEEGEVGTEAGLGEVEEETASEQRTFKLLSSSCGA